MTLSGAISSALSGIQLNANRVAASTDNIVNVSTVGFKATQVQAQSLISGGVRGSVHATVQTQGLLTGTGSPTDLAILGNGFFVVDGGADDRGVRFTRSGSFRPDNQGFLVNDAGFRLLAHPTDPTGNPTSTKLVPVNLKNLGGAASATSKITLGANLPASAKIGYSVTVTAQVKDSLGNNISVTHTFTKSAVNTFTLTVAAPVYTSTGAPAGTTRAGSAGGAPYSVDVIFGGGGLLQGYDVDGDGKIDSASPPGIFIIGSPSGADDLDIALDLGEVGTPDGLTQFGNNFNLGSVEADGSAFGAVSGVKVSSDGVLLVQYDNGESTAVYRVPVAVFTNPGGLQAQSGNTYIVTDASGSASLLMAGSGGVGTVEGGALEQSNVDLGTEFTRVIQAQMAYNFSVKVLKTAEEMSEELLNIKS